MIPLALSSIALAAVIVAAIGVLSFSVRAGRVAVVALIAALGCEFANAMIRPRGITWTIVASLLVCLVLSYPLIRSRARRGRQ